MIKNIVFDWSGVISNDFEVVYHTVRSMFHELGLAPVSFSHFQDVVDAPFRLYLEKLAADQPEIPERFSNRGLTHNLFNRFFEEFGPPAPIAGAINAIPALHSSNFNMGVFSSHHQHFIEAENKRFFGRNYFSPIFGNAGNKLNSIPRFLELSAFKPGETLYVGDTINDMEAGKSVGMPTAAVLSGYHLREKLASAGPDFILNSVAELPSLLRNAP